MKHSGRNLSLALSMAALALGMAGLAYAAVPLYRLFCEATGFGGTVRRAGVSEVRPIDRQITVRFNADTDPSLPWDFRPDTREMVVKLGAQSLTSYYAKNNDDRPVTGHSTYNVQPAQAGAYFVKVHCFCFENQTLPALKGVHMPVSFYIDPALADDPELKDLRTITLSYTFFPATSKASPPGN